MDKDIPKQPLNLIPEAEGAKHQSAALSGHFLLICSVDKTQYLDDRNEQVEVAVDRLFPRRTSSH